MPFFIDNRVGANDDSDIFYDELGNVAYPKYWHSSRSVLFDFLQNPPMTTGALKNLISIKAHYFDCPNNQFASTNNPARTYYDGKMYLFAYGIPSFYCESDVNVDLRQAFNNKEGEFYPNVSTGIPDDWLQESFVPIAQDNTYYYNPTFSKQNKENYISHLPTNWKDQLCFTNYPFRAIYSDPQQSYVDNRINSWLIYRPVSYFDFPQNYGKLVSIDGIQNEAVLVRFENKSLLYNTLLTIDTSNPQAAYMGNSTLFRSAPPIDFAETDLGFVGSQHKMLLKIPQGQVSVDAKRGQVFLLSANRAYDLSQFGSGLNRFFTDHLAFEILRYFPNINIDNNYKGLGVHGVYDSKYDRVIITKLDYVPIDDRVQYDYDKEEFFIEETRRNITIRVVVELSDKQYFCNKSWTLSYNINTGSWVAFHTYLPNWYVGEHNFFYSGINYGCDLDFDAYELVDCLIAGTAYLHYCNLAGYAMLPDCSLAGTAFNLTPPTTTTTSTTTTLSGTTTSTTSTSTTAPPTTTTTTTTATPTTTTTTSTTTTGTTTTQAPLNLEVDVTSISSTSTFNTNFGGHAVNGTKNSTSPNTDTMLYVSSVATTVTKSTDGGKTLDLTTIQFYKNGSLMNTVNYGVNVTVNATYTYTSLNPGDLLKVLISEG